MTEPSKTPTLDALEALKPYPNLSAIIQGTVSGSVTEWPAIRTELVRLCGCFSEGSSKQTAALESVRADLLRFMPAHVKRQQMLAVIDEALAK